MEKGEVRFVGKTEELLARPDILRAVYVKGTGALTAQARCAARAARATTRGAPRRPRGARDSRSRYGGVAAVDDVSFDLHDERVLGLIGPNGAGKTTIFDLISGYQIPDEGRVMFDGDDVTNDAAGRARAEAARPAVPGRATVPVPHRVRERCSSRSTAGRTSGNMALIALQLPQARQSERRVRRRADQLIELLELGAYRDKFVKELSTGLRRITDLACVLATEPRVLLLDEPSSGIAQAEAGVARHRCSQRVRRETGCRILIIEHDMPLISASPTSCSRWTRERWSCADVPGRGPERRARHRVVPRHVGGGDQEIGTRMKRIIALLMAIALAFVAVGCSSEKKVGTAIDVEKLADKNKQLGKLDSGKKASGGGFVGEKEKAADNTAAQEAAAKKNQADQEEAAAKQKEEAAVAVSIQASGFDPYFIRVFTGGVVTVKNNFTKPASITADRGEFDSGLLQPGDSWTYEPKTAGKFNFHDEGRPYVVGTLEVLAN